ncbi:GrpB family protein [Dactylosporangium sp. NPDC006015]|uniref:GrpB family protein n=1 Tax=Dactylosporangium sp. NPDC006015 TaxID=3154576 RepID=UPI0033BA5B8B
MLIEIHDHDPAWAAAARRAVEELTAALPGLFGAVEHVGSTAVPGLAAKPVIDLMAATVALDAVVEADEVLGSLGYRRLETGMRGRLFYRRDGSPVAYHLHVVTADTWDTRNERLLRDHLLRYAADRDEYGALKRRLAGAGHDGDAYTRAKTALIQRMVDAARDARGLPRVDVWED